MLRLGVSSAWGECSSYEAEVQEDKRTTETTLDEVPIKNHKLKPPKSGWNYLLDTKDFIKHSMLSMKP